MQAGNGGPQKGPGKLSGIRPRRLDMGAGAFRKLEADLTGARPQSRGSGADRAGRKNDILRRGADRWTIRARFELMDRGMPAGAVFWISRFDMNWAIRSAPPRTNGRPTAWPGFSTRKNRLSARGRPRPGRSPVIMCHRTRYGPSDPFMISAKRPPPSTARPISGYCRCNPPDITLRRRPGRTM